MTNIKIHRLPSGLYRAIDTVSMTLVGLYGSYTQAMLASASYKAVNQGGLK